MDAMEAQGVMRHARVVRSTSRADERVRLGASATPPLVPANATVVASLPRAAEERQREVAQLREQLAQAHAESEQLRATLADFEAQIADARAEASHRGYEEGAKRASEEAERALAQSIEAWTHALEKASHEYEAHLLAIRAELADVVMTAVAKLLGEHLVNPQSVRATIEHTVKEAGVGVPAKVLLAPSQYGELMRVGAQHVAALRERRIELAPDPRVRHGGCLLEMSSGLVDGRFEQQLARLKDIVAGHYGPGSSAA
jgi:flagellar assembly protein FliH